MSNNLAGVRSWRIYPEVMELGHAEARRQGIAERERRMENGLSLRQLARDSGVNRNTLGRFERGEWPETLLISLGIALYLDKHTDLASLYHVSGGEIRQ